MLADILVVRGSQGFIQNLGQVMGDKYTIRQESTDEAALICIEKLNPDVVLFFPSPGVSHNKYALCSSVRNSLLRRDTPIIVMAGRSNLKNKTKAFEAGATDYLVRPFAPLEVATRISSLIAIRKAQISLANQRRELTHTKFLFLKGMASLAETRDPETGDHLLRVSRYLKVLAASVLVQKTYGEFFNRETIAELSRAAILHDIGKVGVPDNILLKPGKLTPDEFEIMKQHAIYGERIIKKLLRVHKSNAFLLHAAEIAGGHHECWDGSGYPRGLGETEIPLSARLMSVVDVYDSIISPRIYKQMQAHDEAVEFIMDNRGKKFDPVVVDGFHRRKEIFKSIAKRFAPSDLKD